MGSCKCGGIFSHVSNIKGREGSREGLSARGCTQGSEQCLASVCVCVGGGGGGGGGGATITHTKHLNIVG